MDEDGYIFDRALYFSGDVYFKFFGTLNLNDSDNPLGIYFHPDIFNRITSFKEALSALDLKPTATFVKDDGDFFIVANDKYNLYPLIAEKSGLKIVDRFKRPVLNRTEKDKGAYCEIIFHLKNN